MTSMRISAKLPSSGPIPGRVGIPLMARRLEAAGFDGVWVSDHVVMPAHIDSWYPFAADGKATWNLDDPWYDAIVALSMAAAVTERVELGVAVLVLPLRHPVVLAKELASLDALSGGRVAMGLGVGWLSEEFEALGVDFTTRGARFDEWVHLLHECWTGKPRAVDGAHYTLPPGVRMFPTPSHDIPLVIGGHSRAALRRATSMQGWLGNFAPDQIDYDVIAAATAAIGGGQRIILRVVASAGRHHDVAAQIHALRTAGVTEIIVDIDWEAGPDADEQAVATTLRTAAAEVN